MLFPIIFLFLMISCLPTFAGADSSSDDQTKTNLPESSSPDVQYRIFDERGCFELINRPRQKNTWPDDQLIRLSSRFYPWGTVHLVDFLPAAPVVELTATLQLTFLRLGDLVRESNSWVLIGFFFFNRFLCSLNVKRLHQKG
jgi:hypothetical protein